jgi:3-isopropylmalate dehydrogenase
MNPTETKQITVLPGDGIGPEVTREALKILKIACEKHGCAVEAQEMPFGGVSLEQFDTPLTEETLEVCQNSSAVLLGAIGDPKWDNQPNDKRPETGLLQLRKSLSLYANLRPIKIYEPLIDGSTLKADVIRDVDIMIIRELTGGLYFGYAYHKEEEFAQNTMKYERHEVTRIAETAFNIAEKRGKKLCSVDKANVLETSRLWRKTVNDCADNHLDITLQHMLVDNCAMQLVRNPSQFDVILTANMFGDILSDEASMMTGSIGMLPSASLGEENMLFEPVHGSAPDITGEGKANPVAAVASAAMLSRHAFGLEEAAKEIEQAITSTLSAGFRTADIYTEAPDETLVNTSEMGTEIQGHLRTTPQREPVL